MRNILIVCKSGVMYAGALLQDYCNKLEWIGVKPSTKSDVCLWFASNRIEKIYFQDGTSVTREVFHNTIQPRLDLEILTDETLLIRVKGGVSYRGQRLKQVPEEIPRKDGYWIVPSVIRETIIYVPEHEIEKVYIA